MRHLHLIASPSGVPALRGLADTLVDAGFSVTAPLLDEKPDFTQSLRDAAAADAVIYLTPEFCDGLDDDSNHVVGIQLGWISTDTTIPIVAVGQPHPMIARLPQVTVVHSIDAALTKVTDPSFHGCDNGDFDRTICPEPCGSMHSYCTRCGARAGACALDLVGAPTR